MKTLNYMMAGGLCLGFFAFSWFGRYQPVDLNLKAPTTVQAEIKGLVSEPGVYTLPYGSSVSDLIEQAGGLMDQADTSQLALMDPLQDAQVVVVREISEEQLISINTASSEELCALPGIGPAMAERIVSYRQEHPFTSLEQLMEVKGIGEKKYASLKDWICL